MAAPAEEPEDTDALFEQIFAKEDPASMRESMLQLSWQEFEAFVQYVFTCAGYTVQHVASNHTRYHVDLLLYDGPDTSGTPYASVEVRRYRNASIIRGAVVHFVGALAMHHPKRGYLVTTSVFNGPAKAAGQEAREHGTDVHLVDWQHLTRYIAYIRGSRIKGADGRLRTPKPTPPDWLFVADDLPRRDPRKTAVLTVANNKGGVAKTTTALNLGIALAKRGERVLLIDMDGQASLTLALPLPDGRRRPQTGSPLPRREQYLTDYFAGLSSLSELIQPTRFDGLWLIPAHGELHARDTGGSAQPETELAFARAIHDPALGSIAAVPEAGGLDWIILDTPPARSSYNRLALAAAHYVLVPVVVETFAVESINRLLEGVQAMRALMGRDVTLLGCVLTRWQPHSAMMRSELITLQDELAAKGLSVLKTRVPEDSRIERANQGTASGGLNDVFHFRRSAAAHAYADLVQELIKEAQPYVHEPRK